MNRPLNNRLVTGLALAAAALMLPAASRAQTVGPDVIVGDLMDVDNTFGTTGAPAKRMYAVGTTSCNLGDTPLNWVDSPCGGSVACNQHPVITNNMYRLMTISGATRFEQVGQAWLKHGFCALQGTVCSSCTPGGSCDALFPGCSDPYSASLNGTVSGLGPKGEVNPSTGDFPYPWISNGTGGASAVTKRLQVLTTDLDTGLAGGATWYVASMYVQPQDATLHNNNNNESYRRVTVSTSPNYNLTLVDTTQRTKAAIYAWRDNGLGAGSPDPNVYITTVDIPSDGRFIIAAKATNTGALTNPWHYEYAIQNLNSDRAGQAFSVPITAPSTTTANVGFHDVDYNNGDGLSVAQPYSLTDWTGLASGTTVTWSTQTYAVNQAANALRWDTIYNFRFDCNQPPSGGSATLTLFKPGSPTSVSVTTVIPSPDGLFHPLNDTCANAVDVGAGPTAFSNVNANTDGPDEPGACTIGTYTNIGADIWFRYTSDSCTSGPTTITTCGSAFDTKIAVYPASPCPTTSGTFIACNDDSSSCGSGSLQSSLSFNAAANTPYLIRVGGYNAATGNGTLTITPPSCGPVAPPNDNCANAIFLADNVAANGTTINATNDVAGTCGANTTGPDVWYAYRPATSATVNVNTCGSYPPYDTVLSVYSGTCGALMLLGCNDDSYNGGNNACGSGNYSSGLSLAMTGGQTYLIRVGGYNNGTGNFPIRAIGGGGVIPPPNDDCNARPGLGMGPTSFTNVGATTDGPAHAACLFSGNDTITNDLWWNFPSTFNGNLRVDTCSPMTNFDTKIAVYSGSGCTNFDARLLACNDDDAACGSLRSAVTIPVLAGQNYTIRVGGFNGATGSGVLTLTQVPSCGSADFNHDGDIGTDADIEAFFACLGGSCCATCGSADFNGDGDLGTDADIEAFFRVLGGGTC
jgi:hypothetical protein